MKKIIHLVMLLVLSVSVKTLAQPLPCPPISTTILDAYGDTTICDGGCTTIGCTSSTTIKSTSSYVFSTIPYLPTSFTGGTPILVGMDDVWSGLVALPFPFCFYGTKYNSVVVGPNGEIGFNAAVAGTGCPWSIPGPIPTAAGSLNAATLNTIMGAYYDMDPSIPGGGGINWAVYGTAPCRTFVVSWNNVRLYNSSSCPGLSGTQQIVLYESTYAIDIFIHEKPNCTAWNSGRGSVGICDATGANYMFAPGKNGTVWSVTDSAYRFTPDGPASWTYTWYDSHTGGVIGSSSSIVVCPTDSTTYIVKGVASSNCDSYLVYSSVFVNVGDNPNVSKITFTNPTICGANNGTITLHGLIPGISDTIYYKYNGVLQPYVVQVSALDSTLKLLNLCAGVYDSIVVKVGQCHTPPFGPIVLIDPPLTIGIGTVTQPSQCGVCDGSIFINGLLPDQTYTLNYTKDGVPLTLTITTTGSGTYTMSGLCAGTYDNIFGSLTAGACASTCNTPSIGPFVLTWIYPDAIFDTSIHFGCHGDTVLFSNSSTAPYPLYYIWRFGDGVSDTIKNPSHIYQQGTYTVTLVATNHYCFDSAKAELSLLHPLEAGFIADPMLICQGKPVTFTDTSKTGGSGVSHAWSFGDGIADTGLTTIHTFQNTGSYNVQLVITDWVPCKDTFVVPVEVDTISGVVMLATDTVLCAGNYITLTGLYADRGNTGVSWTFSNGDSILGVNPLVHAFNSAGTYTIAVTPHYRACKDTTAKRVINVMPQPTISLGPDTSICAGSEMITLKDEVNGDNTAASWKWNNGSKGSSAIIVAPGLYFATVNINNCYASDTVVVNPDCYMSIPNVFTPNGDGVNDFFYPRSLLSRGLKTFNMDIYNRWGQLVFQTTSLDGAGWDGKVNGVSQPQGVFVYIIDATFRDGQREHHQGNVTLMR